MDKLHELPAYIAVDLIRQGKLKPSGLMQAYAEQISLLEPKVGAFTHLDLDSAVHRAKVLDSEPPIGLLFGLPVGVKDLMDTADMPTSYGSPIYRHHCPLSDAACLTEVKSQGAVIMGKTVTTEFAIFHPGKTANPHNVAHTPGGSSSGSAAAVAAHMVPLAFGTQTAASVYRPASFCGVVGYKPSYGLIQRGGIKTLSESFDTVGLIANCVMDVALLAAAASRRHHLLPSSNHVAATKPTVGLFRTPHWEMAEQASQAAVLGFADRLSAQGVKVIDIDVPAVFEQLLQAQTDVMLAEAAIALGYEYVHHKALCSPKLIEVIEQGNSIGFDRLQAAHETINQARAAIRDIFRGVDVLLSPAAVGEAPEGLQATGDPVFGRAWTALRTPGLTIPGATGPKGLPIGVLLSGAQDNDAQFLLAAHVLEQLGKP
jgi:Asp-tRNA(Asn)/Glu-tRNA(Gln) amidotransferase A subunit family amidase